MRKLQPIRLAACVALALASMAADAATTTAPPASMVAGPRPVRVGAFTPAKSAVPAAPASSTSGSTGGNSSGSTSGTSGSSDTTTTTDTSTTTATTGTGTTSGASQDGTSTGSVLTDSVKRNLAAARDTRSTTRATNSLSPNATNGGLSPNAANGSTSPNATTTTTTSTTTRGGVANALSAPGGLAVIDTGTAGFANGLTANGERVGSQIYAEASISPNAILDFAENDVVVTRSGSTVILPQLSAVERQELRKRQHVGRNQQLLNTIAPRTNIDRTWQMADDPPTPALKTP